MALNINLNDLKNINLDTVINLPFKVKIYIVAGIVVLLWGLYIGLVGFPKYKSISGLKTEISDLTQKRDKKKADAASLPKLKAEVAKLEKDLKYSMTVLPDDEEIPKIINTVQDNLRKFGLEILSFKPDKEIKRDFYAEIPISLKFSGGFKEMGEFCQTIGRYPRIINILNVSVRDPKIKDGKVALTAETRAFTYRFLRPEEMPKKPAPAPAPKK